jgi:hypothetical protein
MKAIAERGVRAAASTELAVTFKEAETVEAFLANPSAIAAAAPAAAPPPTGQLNTPRI